MFEVFKLEKDKYTTDIDPINHYIEQASKYIATQNHLPIEEAKKKVKNVLNKLKQEHQIRNPRVRYRERTLDGKIINNQYTTILGYINYVKQNDDILVPSFTVYFNRKKKKSLHAEFISENIALRSKHKKLAFKYKMDGDKEKSNYHNTLQKSMKIKNNSLSGAYASAGTVLYNPSAHYTLTSITRCVSGIGNAISESMITGNRHYRDPNVTLNHLTAIVTNIDMDNFKQIMDKYELYYPTAEEVLNKVILKSSKYYWRNTYREHRILEFLKRLSPVERAAITYVNDLYQLREFNPEFVRKLLDSILFKEAKINTVEQAIEVLKSLEDWIINLLLHLKADIVRGRKYVLEGEDKLPDEVIIDLAKAGLNAQRVFHNYKDLIQTLFVTKVFPISIAYIRDMLREVIVLSDTDSTCATYQNWIEWYFGKPVINSTAIGLTAIVMTFNTQAIDHYIKVLGANMNIGYEGAKNLQMKNEFFWDVFVNTDVSKHYFANVRIQEGNVFKEPDLEKKGVHLIASYAYQPVRDLAEKMMRDIMDTISRNEKLSLTKYLKQVVEAEQMIIKAIKSGSPNVLKLEKIKEPTAYKAEMDKSPYLQYLLWQDVFADKYGNAPDPTYMAVKIPTIINSKKDMENWLSSLEDQEFTNKFREFMKKYNKTEIKTFKFPLVNLHNKGFPKEIMDIIDIKKVVKDNCNMLYIILNSMGYYVKPNLILSEELPFLKDAEKK